MGLRPIQHPGEGSGLPGVLGVGKLQTAKAQTMQVWKEWAWPELALPVPQASCPGAWACSREAWTRWSPLTSCPLSWSWGRGSSRMGNLRPRGVKAAWGRGQG